MKKTPLLVTLGLLISSTIPGLATPLLRYEFDQPGAIQSSTGSSDLALTIKNYANANTDYITTTPQQRADGAGGHALNFTFSNVDEDIVDTAQRNRGAAVVALNDTNASFLRGDLSSFTISAWVYDVQPRGGVSGARRLFTLRDGSSAVIDFYLAPSGTSNYLHLGMRGSEGFLSFTAPEAVSVPVANDSWHFISLAYNADTGSITFYTGQEGGTLSSATLYNVDEGNVNTLLTNATQLTVGNARYNDQRRFDGYISDFRFYGTELTAAEIGSIYAIPEPSAALLIGASLLVMTLRPWKLINR